MAWRLRLAPEKTNIDFFKHQWLTFGGSALLMVLAFLAWGVMGLNFGIDFKGGTTLRTESVNAVNVGAYRAALEELPIGDAAITEVFDTNFAPDQHVAMIRVSAAEQDEALSPELLNDVKAALVKVDPQLKVVAEETVGPKVSSELVWTSVLAVGITSIAIMGRSCTTCSSPSVSLPSSS